MGQKPPLGEYGSVLFMMANVFCESCENTKNFTLYTIAKLLCSFHNGLCPVACLCMDIQGILCTCRFLWICPYNAIQFLPRERQKIKCTKEQAKVNKVSSSIPGSPDRTTNLHNRVTKNEKDILALKTRIACERTSWERRFAELHRKQEQLLAQMASEGALRRMGSESVDTCEVFEECTNDASERIQLQSKCEVSSRADTSTSSSYSCDASEVKSSLPSSSSSVSSVKSWRSSPGPHRVFVPHSALDLQLGHRVRIMLPTGRISTGVLRFMGHLQGEEELHLGIELHSPDHGLRDGSYKGQCYFECKPGHGAFVPFHKLLMAWE
ncbi:hypothetical protein WMY93_026882 [Mugilogobius chulae]|uniref:CAP-Gly domain-containing protein n=1 Tax=Mugilogobius chulae TaxID=88201 RepID=A0AAW0N926_9GOBI